MREELVEKIRGHFKAKGFEKAVIGLSGGLDSAVACLLLVEALGRERVLAYSMPYFSEDPDVRAVEEKAGLRVARIGIKGPVDSLCEALGTKDRVAKGNVMARVRMVVLYHFARENNALVVGTGNRTEWLLGYFTKHGDIACDVLPIGGLYKTQVRELARELGMPEHIIKKAPTAGLWPGQTDEAELGFSYEEIDARLQGGGDGLKERMRKTEHKRKGPDVL